MASQDNSIHDNLINYIETLIDDTSISDQWGETELETVIWEGQKEMAINCDRRNTNLRVSSDESVTSKSFSRPADYLWHDEGAVMECTTSAGTELIREIYSREEFNNGTLDGRNFFIIEGATIKVNRSEITSVLFEYVKVPAELDGSANTEFENRMFNHLAHYVIAKLFMRDNAEENQKARALHHFVQFYKLIGNPNFQKLAEAQVA